MFTFFLVIDRVYQLTDLVISKQVPVQSVLSLLLFLLQYCKQKGYWVRPIAR